MTVNDTTQTYTSYITQNVKTEEQSSFNQVLQEQQESSVESSSVTSTTEEPKERIYNLVTYENTKGMSDEDVEKYFPNKSDNEKMLIRAMIDITENFSDNDMLNEAIFEEAKLKQTKDDMLEYSIQLLHEKDNFQLGVPSVANAIRVSDLNMQYEVAYNNGNPLNFSNINLTNEEAKEYIVTMFNLSKQRMEESAGTAVYDDYKQAFERYERIYNSYTEKLEAQKV